MKPCCGHYIIDKLLINQMDSVQIDPSENPREFKQKDKPQAKTQGQMTCEFLKISLPLLIYENMFYVIVVINVIFAGRLNDSTKMAGIGLGTTFNHMFGLCVFFGINTAMETLINVRDAMTSTPEVAMLASSDEDSGTGAALRLTTCFSAFVAYVCCGSTLTPSG